MLELDAAVIENDFGDQGQILVKSTQALDMYQPRVKKYPPIIGNRPFQINGARLLVSGSNN